MANHKPDAITRLPVTLAALAALANGLIAVALGVGMPIVLAIIWVALGLFFFTWSVLTFVRGRFFIPWVSFALFIAPIVVWAGLLIFAPHLTEFLPPVTVLVSSLLSVYVAASIAALMKEHRVAQGALVRSQKGWKGVATVLGIIVGAVVVAGVTVQALPYTKPGLAARSHSDHMDNAHHGEHSEGESNHNQGH